MDQDEQTSHAVGGLVGSRRTLRDVISEIRLRQLMPILKA